MEDYMKAIDWMLLGNINITYLVNVRLLEHSQTQSNDGYIQEYLKRYNKNNKMWGNGLYGPKWISSTYTLLDLINLHARPDRKMIEGYAKLRKEIVLKYTLNPNDERTLDLCIVGMLIRIGAYVKSDESQLRELIDFVLHTVNSDGAWNCYYNYRVYQTSSLHTTINILEGLLEYVLKGYQYRIDEVMNSMKSANEFMLQKKLFRSRRTNEIISEEFLKIHYPTRWFYDMYRTLDYFARAEVEYDQRMDEALVIVKDVLSKGPLPKGKTYGGRIHFKYEMEDYRRINTLRALCIVRYYDNEFYRHIIDNSSFKK